jgi:hypothetical protein
MKVLGDAEINSLEAGATEAADLAVAEGPKAGLRARFPNAESYFLQVKGITTTRKATAKRLFLW